MSETKSTQLAAGVARAIITPPIGIPLVGFAGRGPSTGVHDELSATALVLEAQETRVALLCCDLIGFPEALTTEVQQEVERRTGIPAPHVVLHASHTHYGPSTRAYEEGRTPAPDVAAYNANLRFVLAGLVQAAAADLQPVTLGFGRGASDIGVNRRERKPDGRIVLGNNPNGPIDREVTLIRLDTEAGAPLAMIVNFACHPVCQPSMCQVISADFVEPARELAETFTGATMLFLQGAAGNINPVERGASFETARRLGVMLGGEIVQVFERTPTALVEAGTRESILRAAVERIELPALTCESVEGAEAEVVERRAETDRLRAQGASSGSLHWAQQRLARAEGILDSLRSGTPLPTVPAPLSAWRVGEVGLVFAPGEIFTETGMAVKRASALRDTCFAAYTAATIGYVPVPEAYPEGGYEVTHACRVAPAAAGMITDTALSLLRSVTTG
jgi:Neutral/alkaline non-lysosomal ceramidase, N-terminal